MASASAEGLGNNLLRALRPGDFELVKPHLTPQQMRSGAILYRPGDEVRTVYFPTGGAFASFLIELPEGKCVETALIGREGAIGGVVSQGRLPAYAYSVVQMGGMFLAMPSSVLGEIKGKSQAVGNLFARYADCVVAQTFQSAACNAGHSIEQRCAKWLVAAVERTGQSQLSLTQEQLAGMLGIGRSYISQVIGTFRAQSLVKTRRGGMVMQDIDALRAIACDCNEQVKRHFEDVLCGVYPSSDDSSAPNGHPAKDTCGVPAGKSGDPIIAEA